MTFESIIIATRIVLTLAWPILVPLAIAVIIFVPIWSQTKQRRLNR